MNWCVFFKRPGQRALLTSCSNPYTEQWARSLSLSLSICLSLTLQAPAAVGPSKCTLCRLFGRRHCETGITKFLNLYLKLRLLLLPSCWVTKNILRADFVRWCVSGLRLYIRSLCLTPSLLVVYISNADVGAPYGLLIILAFIKTLVNTNKFTIQQSMYSFY
jgi:hypothetical protein